MTLPIPTDRRQLVSYIRDARRRLWVEIERARLGRRNDGPTRPPALASLPSGATVLVLCWGNICRSPMAERYLRKRLAETGREDVTVRSAGFVEQDSRRSPDSAVAVASEHGIDLSEHRAQRVTREMVAESDVIFVMDVWNYHDVLHEFPDAADRVYFLADEREDGFEIRDPHHRGVERFETAYGTIADVIDRLVESR